MLTGTGRNRNDNWNGKVREPKRNGNHTWKQHERKIYSIEAAGSFANFDLWGSLQL